MIDESLTAFEERTVYKLRSLYKKYGYLPYKMSKFEEYELYLRNKDFLVSDRVITFNDTDGKLMALKPDVTLSIIKNGEDVPGVKQKVFYNENVYRVSDSTHRFKEIMQTGLECIGDIDVYDICEVITLATQSLSLVSDDYCIDVCDLDLVYSVISSVYAEKKFISDAIRFVSEKNTDDLERLCAKYGAKDGAEKISALVNVYGDRKEVISRLSGICGKKEISKLQMLSDLLDLSAYSDRIKFDFSVVNAMNYYNGFVFEGFVSGICSGVLSGGQYDGMMKKLKRSSGAVGFAIYLDRLEELCSGSVGFDVDTLLLYGDNTDPGEVAKKVSLLIASGKSVSAQKSVPEKLRYKEIEDMRKKGDIC